jgi:glucose/arabinose dehydrogenase
VKLLKSTKYIWGFAILIIFIVGYWTINYFAIFKKIPEHSFPVANQVNKQSSPVLFDLEIVADNLFVPWSLVFTSENRILVSERNGDIRVIENGILKEKPLTHFSVSQKSEEGLMGMAIDPDYSTNHTIYACLAAENTTGLFDSVISFTDSGDSVSDVQTIISNIPAAQYHAGCRLMFLPDKTLLITSGDSTKKELAQNLDSLAGKILRINRDGSIPNDNPFQGSPVWSYGHRNSQGLALDTVNNNLWSSEHGPSIIDGPAGGDEINYIEKGKNYGWPLIHHTQSKEGLNSPVLEFTPAIAPSGILYYSGDMFPQFTNKLLVAALKGEGIFELSIDQKNPKTISGFEKNKDISVGRIREIAQSPDGSIYFATSNQDGRGKKRSNDDKIYKLVPRK